MTGHEDIPALQADFRTAVIRAVIAAGDNPKNPRIEKEIEDFEKYYATYLEQTRIYISGKNDIPGFRQVLFLGQEFFLDHDMNRQEASHLGVIAITSDFRLVTGVIFFVDHESKKNQETITTARTIGSLVNSDESNLKFFKQEVNFKFTLRDPVNHDQGCHDIHDQGGYDQVSCSCDKVSHSVLKSINYCMDVSLFKSETRKRIGNFLVQQNRNRFAPVYRAITDALDEDILCDMRKNNLMKVSEGRWLTGGDGVATEVVTARQQAIRVYPLLSEMFLECNYFRHVIDRRTSLSKAIADHFNVDQGKVKRLSGLTWQQVGLRPGEKNGRVFDNMISGFLRFPDNSFPKNARQFQDLDILEEFGKNVYGEQLADFVGRLLKNGNPWRFIDKMRQTSGSNVDDSIGFLSRKLVVPAMIDKSKHIIHDEPTFHRMMYVAQHFIRYHFKIGELLEWDKRYHRNIARYEDRLDFISINREWPGMLGTIDPGNDCIVRELTSSIALKTQGRLEDHCVGGYVSRVLNSMEHSEGQATMIFSLEQNDRILGTVEIRCSREHSVFEGSGRTENDLLRVYAIRTLAYSNTTPCRMARHLAEQVVTRLQQAGPDAFRTYLDGLHEAIVKQDRISGLEFHVGECGFDPCNHVHLEAVWEEIGRFLPQRFRRNGLDALVRELSRSTCEELFSEMQHLGIQFDGQDCTIHAEGQRDIHSEKQRNIHSEKQRNVYSDGQRDVHSEEQRDMHLEGQRDVHSEGSLEHDGP